MSKAVRILLGVLAALAVAAGVWVASKPEVKPLAPTIADIEAVHAEVRLAGEVMRGVRRGTSGDALETDADGRARVRLDDGTSLVVDRGTKLVLSEKGTTLEAGRVFVVGAPDARAEITALGATVIVKAANAGIEVKDDAARIYSANDEVVVASGGVEHKVRAGESATISGTSVEVAAEKAFDDWTGGLAAPWGALGSARRAVGELWARPDGSPPGDAGSPLMIRAHDVLATITGEAARTLVTTTYFNGGSGMVSGDFRMAIPESAIVSRFAWGLGDQLDDGEIALAARDSVVLRPTEPVLEWAGVGWLRGQLPGIPSGASVKVVIEYIEWLSPKEASAGRVRVQYRYPMASDGEPPLIGEFSARVDARPSAPIAIASSHGATAQGGLIEMRRPDFRPVADLVVDVELAAEKKPARMYVANADDEGGDGDARTIFIRTEAPRAPPDAGATLALVVDTSGSSDPSVLDASRAFVEAMLRGLGTRDRVVVLAADQTARAVGPEELGPVDDARRASVTSALAKLAPGGATDLGRALEAGADALGTDTKGLVVYVGDGWPTVGDPTIEHIRARLARRPGGAPRLGAVAVGPVANRVALAGLARGTGPLLEVTDSSDGALAAVRLIADALQPTVTAVELVLGPEVDEVYPRAPRAVVAGSTVTAVGRVRGPLPKTIRLRFRDGEGMKDEVRMLSAPSVPDEGDVRRRWAAARVEEVMLTGRGREAATDVAMRARLLTPWTGFRVSGRGFVPSLMSTRVLDLSSAIGSVFATPTTRFGALTDVPYAPGYDESADEGALADAINRAAARAIERAAASLRACRDSRAALRPDLFGDVSIELEIDGEGNATNVKLGGGGPVVSDAALSRCIQVVIEGVRYPASGLGVRVKVKTTIAIPRTQSVRKGRKCSATSRLPLPLRRGVWRERLDRTRASDVYLDAKHECELPSWTARRALLELVLEVASNGLGRVAIARELEEAGESDAAELLRREAVRRAGSPAELVSVKEALVGDERFPRGAFTKRYQAATTNEGRLDVVRRFLTIAPHDASLRRRLLAVLEAIGGPSKSDLVDEIRRIRLDPFADARLLADAASTLGRLGTEHVAEARRTFGELAERAPSDPWARAFLGDRLRVEGWFDDATAAYGALEQLMPDDPAAAVRLALAHHGAGRVDIARRLLARVAQTGGRAGNRALATLASRLASVLLAEARAKPGLAKEDVDRLVVAALDVSRSEQSHVLVLRAPAAGVAVDAKILRGERGTAGEISMEVQAAEIGISSVGFDVGEKVVLRLSRPKDLAPSRATPVRVDVLVPSGSPLAPPALVSTSVELPIDGKPVELSWKDGRFAS